MHICMLTSEFPPDLGGISYYVANLSRRLLKRGHRVTVISRGSWLKSRYEHIDGIDIYRVRFTPSLPSPLWLHGKWVNSLLKSLKADIDLIHAHGSLIPVPDTSPPMLLTNHGTTKEDIANMPVKSFHFLMVRLLSGQLLKLEERLLKRADAISAVSEACSNEIREHCKDKDISVIRPGVDSACFVASDSDKGYILFAGRLETRKGLSDLIMAASLVRRINHNARFVIAGKGTVEDQLKRYATRLGLENNVHFAGFVSSDKLLRHYQNASMFVLPSYYEGLPTVLLEAMACGLPVVATSVGGVPELVEDGKTGILVAPRKPEMLAEAIIKLLNNPEMRRKIGQNARRHVVENYDWEIITDKIEGIYRVMLDNASSASREVACL